MTTSKPLSEAKKQTMLLQAFMQHSRVCQLQAERIREIRMDFLRDNEAFYYGPPHPVAAAIATVFALTMIVLAVLCSLAP